MSTINSHTQDLRDRISGLQADARASANQIENVKVATVMGTAAEAAIQPGNINDAIQNDAMLTSLINKSDNADAIRIRIQQISNELVKDAAIDAVNGCIDTVQKQITEPLHSALTKGISDANECNAEAKQIIAKALHIAGHAGADNQDAIVEFDNDIQFIADGLKTLAQYDLEADDLQTKIKALFDPTNTLDVDQKSDHIQKLRAMRVELENLKRNEQFNIAARFDDATIRNKDTDTRRQLVQLEIPKDMTHGKGQTAINGIKNFMRGRATDYFAIIPYLNRMFNDFDPSQGTYFKPPELQDGYSALPKEFYKEYKQQSALLWAELMRVLQPSTIQDIQADFMYGMHDQLGPTHCMEGDGVMAVFCLITKFRPQDADFRDRIEGKFIEAHKHFMTGDPRAKIQHLRELLNDAIKLKIGMKWSTTGKTIAQVVARRDPDLADAVRAFKTISPSNDDTPNQINRMFAAIKLACNDIDKGTLGNSNKNWNYKAHSGMIVDVNKLRTPIKDRLGARPKVKCRYGKSCRFGKNCRFDHSEDGKQPGDTSLCKAEGCKANVNNGKKLCKKHFDIARTKGAVKLKDGTNFEWRQGPRKEPEQNKFKFDVAKVALAACKVFSEAQASNQEGIDDEVLRMALPVGPLQHKRQAITQRAQSAKKSKTAIDDQVERVLQAVSQE